MTKTLGIRATGGVAPGINAVVKCALTQFKEYGFDRIILFRDGFKPLQNRDFDAAQILPFSDEVLKNLDTRGGCVLGNLKPGIPTSDEHYKNIIEGLKHFDVHHLLSPGGDDSIHIVGNILRFAKKLNYPLFQAVIPKTIDNDVNLDPTLPYEEQARTLGFDTCAEFATNVFNGLKHNSSSLERYYGYTSMGRHSGRLAYEIAKRGKADLLLVKEMFALSWNDGTPGPFYQLGFYDLAAIILMSHLMKQAEHKSNAPFEHSVVIAENIVDIFIPGTFNSNISSIDGNPVLAEAQIGDRIAEHLQDYLQQFGKGEKVTWVTMDASARGQNPNEKDRNLAFNCTKKALEMLSKDAPESVVYSRPDATTHVAPFAQFIDENGKGVIRMLPEEIVEKVKTQNVFLPKYINDGTLDKIVEIAGIDRSTILPVAWKAANALFPTR